MCVCVCVCVCVSPSIFRSRTGVGSSGHLCPARTIPCPDHQLVSFWPTPVPLPPHQMLLCVRPLDPFSLLSPPGGRWIACPKSFLPWLHSSSFLAIPVLMSCTNARCSWRPLLSLSPSSSPGSFVACPNHLAFLSRSDSNGTHAVAKASRCTTPWELLYSLTPRSDSPCP